MNYLLTVILAIGLGSCSINKNLEIDSPAPNQKSEVFEQKTDTNQFCYPSCPLDMPESNIEINHEDFLLSYNITTKYADWVGYKIQASNICGPNKNRIWQADPKLPLEVSIIPEDYKDAYAKCNYDRGHQAPFADFSNGLNWEKVNYLSNITPQKSKLNQGPWERLETSIRLLGKKEEINKSIYVLTGPYYNSKPMCQLPNARISNIVPNGYWKIITLVKDDNIYRASFKFDQDTPKDANFCDHLVSVEEIAKITKINFNIQDKTDNSLLLQRLGCGIT